MVVNGFLQVFALGVLGGCLSEVLKLFHVRTRTKLPEYLKSPFYWVVTVLFVLISGVLATLYGVTDVNALLAVNIGASAPLIISGFSRTVPEKTVRGFALEAEPELSLGTRFHTIANA